MPIVDTPFGTVNVSQKLYDELTAYKKQSHPTFKCKHCGVMMRYSTRGCGHNDFMDMNICPKCKRSYSGYGVDELKRNVMRSK